MDEKKYVTLEMFEQYHKKLMEYIGMHDDLMLEGKTTCPKCGGIMDSVFLDMKFDKLVYECRDCKEQFI